MAGKEKRRVYTLDTKLEAIRLREEEGLIYREITGKLGISEPEQ